MLTRNGSALARLCAGPLALSEPALDWAEGRAARALALQEAGGAPQGGVHRVGRRGVEGW